MTKPTLYIPVGIPGSGKSTWARSLNATVVSTDEIRIELFGSLVAANDPQKARENNALVFRTFEDKISILLRGGRDIVADATNLDASSRRTLRNLASRGGATSTVVVFDNIAQGVEWNNSRVRTNPDAFVPDVAMDRLIGKFLAARESVKGEPQDETLWR